MQEVGVPKFDPRGLHWRVVLVKNYVNGTSAVVFKCSHMLSDGIGALLMAGAIQGKPNPKQLPLMRHFTLMDKIVYYASLVLSPYYLVQVALKYQRGSNEMIPLLTPVNKDYSCAASPGFKLIDIKRVCKAKQCTINDFLTAAFTTSLSKLIKERGC